MKTTEKLFCKLICLALHPHESSSFSEEEIQEITREINAIFLLAQNHNMQVALYDSLCTLNIPLPTALENSLQQMIVSYSMGSYRMLAFTRYILSVLVEEQIHYILLKGASLLACYPKLEFRGYGDVDILVSDPAEFKKIKKRFLAEGFYIKEDYVDHQLELFYSDGTRQYLLELHSKVISSQENKQVNQKIMELYTSLKGIPVTFDEADLSYYVFPHTENTLYLLLHMLQHFLNSGFGVKLLSDWTTYIEKHHDEIDWTDYYRLTSSLGLTGFSHAMAQLCIKYFGLPENYILLYDEYKISDEALQEFITDILNAGEFGKNDTSRMLIMVKEGSPLHYLQQFHRQMKNRFQKAHRIFLLWPILWIMTGIYFLWNNHTLRKTSTREVLATTKKRHHLLKELRLFQLEK